MRHRRDWQARDWQAGVTLIEMLVVLVLIGVVAGAMALSLPRRGNEASVETTALVLAATLRRAVTYALDHQTGFGIRVERRGYRVMQRLDEEWITHADPALARLKLFPAHLRIDSYDNNNATFGVTQNLEPTTARLWKLAIGQGSGARLVTFDGIGVRIAPLKGN